MIRTIKKYTCILTVLFLLLLSVMCPLVVHASENSNCTINIECGHQNMKWFLYRVGDAREDGSIGYDEAFRKYNLPDGPLSYDEIQSLTFTFESYVNMNANPPDQSGAADRSGHLDFAVDEGWYIVIPARLVTEEKVYRSTSVMVCVSSCDIYSDRWGKEITISPKSEESQRDPAEQPLKVLVVRFMWDSESVASEEPIYVTVYQDGIKKETIVLSHENNWVHVFPDIPYDSDWSAVQENIPQDRTIVYRKEPGYHPVEVVEVITIQHYVNPETSQVVTTVTTPFYEEDRKSEKLPQTGQLWWPVPLLAVSGILLFFSGYIIERRRQDHEERDFK